MASAGIGAKLQNAGHPSLRLGNPHYVARVGNFVFVILRVLATVSLVLFGLGMFWFGIHMGKQRERLETAFRGTDTEEWSLRSVRSLPWLSLFLGVSALAASILVWVNPVLSVVIVAPFVVRLVQQKPHDKTDRRDRSFNL